MRIVVSAVILLLVSCGSSLSESSDKHGDLVVILGVATKNDGNEDGSTEGTELCYSLPDYEVDMTCSPLADRSSVVPTRADLGMCALVSEVRGFVLVERFESCD